MRNLLRLMIALVIPLALAASVNADTMADWTFDQYTGTYTSPNPALNSPVPASGTVAATGVASPLGMTNSYTYNGGEGPGSVTWCDTTSGNPSTGISWRIRGPTNASGGGAGQANGWNSAAPQYTQGAEFAVNTTGYSNIGVSFDWMSTTQGAADLQPRYTLDGTNFTNIGPVLEMNPADVNNVFDTFTLNFSGIPGANNNPNFGVELVSAFHGTSGVYANAASVAAGSPAPLNNSSGNWRLDNIVFTGTAVPEPASILLGSLGVAGVVAFGWRRRWNNTN